MEERQAWVAMAGGKGRSYLEYFLAQNCVCVGWGNLSGDLSGLRARYADRLNKTSQEEICNELKGITGTDKKALKALRNTISVRSGDIVFIARWPFVGEILDSAPYHYDSRCTIGGWDLYHRLRVRKWLRMPDSEWIGMKKWKRGPAIGRANVGSVEAFHAKMNTWQAINVDVSWISSLGNRDETVAKWPDEYVLLGLDSKQANKIWEEAWTDSKFDPGAVEDSVLRDVIEPVLRRALNREVVFEHELHEIDSLVRCAKCSQPCVFIEAKKPSKSIYTEGIHRQLRRYAQRSKIVWQDKSKNCTCHNHRVFIVSNGRHWRFFRLGQDDLLEEITNIHFRAEGKPRMWKLDTNRDVEDMLRMPERCG